VSVDVRVYSGEGVEPRDGGADEDLLAAARDADGTTWVRVVGTDRPELDSIAAAFGIHDLELEDVRYGVRPKTELFDDHTFVLLKTARIRSGETTFEEEVRDVPVGIFLGSDWLVTLESTELSPVTAVWQTVGRAEPRLLEREADFTAYRIADRIVDDYFGTLDGVEEDIERVEDGIIDAPDPATLETINSLRRELLSMRRIVWPTRDALGTLSRGEPDQVCERTEKYFRDVYDHLVQLVDLIETYRDLVSGARDIYLNTLSQSTNEVMKRLTVVATIVLPLTFVVGLFGMNFGDSRYNMPELGWPFAYPAVMLGMLGVALVLVVHFRAEGWL
jgi:magnesium transporter